MADFNYTVKNGDRGLTYIFLDKAKEAGYEGDASKINWNNVLSVFDEVQAEEKAEGEQLYSGGNDKTRAGWRNSYIVKAGDVINLTKSQLDKIYTAMGFKKVNGAAGAAQQPAAGAAQPPATGATPQPAAGAAQPPAAGATPQPATVTLPSAVTLPEVVRIPSSIPSAEVAKYLLQNKHNAGKAILQPDGTTVVYNEDGRIEKYLDENGKTTREISYNSDGIVDEFNDYKYDTAGNNTRRINYNSDGSVNLFTDWECDADGKSKQRINYTPDGSVDSIYRWEYDAAGKRTRFINYNLDGSVWYFIDKEYDADGNQIRMTWYNPDGTVQQ